MRMRLCVTLAVVVFSQLHANGQSIQPFYTLKDVTFKTELLGRWNVDTDVALEFRDLGQNTYGITLYGDAGYATYFRAHLFQIGPRYFLDAQVSGLEFPLKDRADGNENARVGPTDNFSIDKDDILLNRHHGLILIEFASNKDEFTGHLWRDDFLPTLAKNKKLNCPFMQDEMGRLLLTGSSSQLRSFVERLPADAFDNDTWTATLTREKGQPH